MKVLVSCEESQAVTIALRKLGHEAFSCDVIPCSGGHPEWHIVQDVLPLLNGWCQFDTMDGVSRYHVGPWDMIIAFPPCTYLSCVGAPLVFNRDHTVKDRERYQKGIDAAKFFRMFLDADCERIAVENPRQLRCFGLPPATQFVEPYMFGEPWRKKTGLWIKGLPQLKQTQLVEPQGLWVGTTSGFRERDPGYPYKLHGNRDPKRRAKTFPGVARAMAEQWAGVSRKETAK